MLLFSPRGAWLWAALGWAGLSSAAGAHPHMWIDYSATVLCQDGAVAGVRIAWTFDQMYSASLFHDYTSRPTGPLSAADIAELNKGAFQDSAEQHFFTDIVLDGKKVPVTKAIDFDASYDGRKMTYRFTVPLTVRPGATETVLDIDSFDTEFYIDFEPTKRDPIAVRNKGRLAIACAVTPVPKDTTTFGPVDSQILRCRIRGTA